MIQSFVMLVNIKVQLTVNSYYTHIDFKAINESDGSDPTNSS